jgi:hypothetical protein
MSSSLARVATVYHGSDGDATKALYVELEQLGPIGVIAMNLMRAQKASERAKKYRGGAPGKGSYRQMAYERKDWAIGNLCAALAQHGAAAGLTWGWGIDENAAKRDDPFCHVFYVDLPTGQVSFHRASRGDGPDYPGQWDGANGKAIGRVVAFAARVLDGQIERAA